jgi:hypothetical protein
VTVEPGEPRIVLPSLSAPVDELWHVLLNLAEQLQVPWTLVGGQMVLLHALEHGQTPPVVSQDGDMLADIRAEQAALKAIVAVLRQAGFEPEVAADDVVHRYQRPTRDPKKPLKIDLLAPDGVGSANLTTTPPGRTVQAPGGTQSLNRTQMVVVVHEGREGRIPRPTLVAAIVMKAAAIGLPGDPAKHLRDVALLCAVLDDPFTAAEQLVAKDRQRLRLARALADADHPAWALLPDEIRANGHAAYGILAGAG